MESSPGVGFLAVVAISGSVAFIARLVHKRLVSDFMRKIELEFSGSAKLCQGKKKVRFADDVRECEKGSDMVMRKAELAGGHHDNSMPLNRQVLYKQILEHKALRRP